MPRPIISVYLPGTLPVPLFNLVSNRPAVLKYPLVYVTATHPIFLKGQAIHD
jgi:hypothetical protein